MTPIAEALCLTDLSSSPDLAGCVTLGEVLCLWAAASPHWHGRGTSRCGVLGSGARTPAGAPGLLLHPPCPLRRAPPSGGTPTLCRGTPRQGEQGAEEDPARGRRMGE